MNLDVISKEILDLQKSSMQQNFIKNMEVLKATDINLYNRIKAVKKDEEYLIIKEDASKQYNLVSFEKQLVFYDIDNTMSEVALRLNNLNIKNTRLAVFLGLGLGYELMYFIEAMSKEQNTEFLLVVEKDIKIFIKALEASDLRAILKNYRIKFLVGEDIDNLFVVFREYLSEQNKYLYLKTVNYIDLPIALKLDKEYYLEVIKKFREAGVFHVNYYGNDPNDSLIGLVNILKNINEIIYNPGINLLYEKFKGKPAIIASTGPSLNKNKHLLKGLEDKALIVAPDASLKVLLELGVKPHIVTALERTDGILPLIQGFTKEQVKDVYFAACPVIDKKVYEAYKGPRIITYRNFQHFNWINIDRGILDIKLSSGNMAFKIAEALGCDPIILIGQDLAFGEDGKTHAEGSMLTLDEEKQKERQQQFIQRGTLYVKGNTKNEVLTSTVWYKFLKSYELDVANYKGRCINATEGGAYIEGTEVMAFRDAIAAYVAYEINPLDTIKEKLAGFTDYNAKKDLINVTSILANTIQEMRKIIDLCAEGVQKCNKYEDELNSYIEGSANPNDIRISEIHEEIFENKHKAQREIKSYQSFFMHIIQSFEIKFTMELLTVPEKYDNKLASDAEVIMRQKEWYGMNYEIGKIALDALEKAKDELIKFECEN